MNARLLSLFVVVAALTGYHLAQRAMPGAIRPAPLFAFVYGAAALVMIAAVTIDGSGGLRAVSGTATHWAPWLLVLSVAGIELELKEPPPHRGGHHVARVDAGLPFVLDRDLERTTGHTSDLDRHGLGAKQPGEGERTQNGDDENDRAATKASHGATPPEAIRES